MSVIETIANKPSMSAVFDNQSYRLIDEKMEFEIDSGILDINKYMNENDGSLKTETEKDEMYKFVIDKFTSVKEKLKNLKIEFYLNRGQYNYLTDLITKKIEYDTNTLFVAIDLTNWLGGISNTKFTSDKEVKSFTVDPTQLTFIYHLISPHKVRGLTKDSYTFAEILRRIGEISKIVNYYDNELKVLSGGADQSGSITGWALKLNGDGPIQSQSLEKGTEEKMNQSV